MSSNSIDPRTGGDRLMAPGSTQTAADTVKAALILIKNHHNVIRKRQNTAFALIEQVADISYASLQIPVPETIPEQLLAAPSAPDQLSPPAYSPVMPRTCYFWSTGNCKYGDACTRAHYFFPTIVHRAHRAPENPSNIQQCSRWVEEQHSNRCYWPAGVCGFVHGEMDAASVLARKKVERSVLNAPWEAVVVLKCKACGKGFESVEEVRKHCEAGGGCGDAVQVRELPHRERSNWRSGSDTPQRGGSL